MTYEDLHLNYSEHYNAYKKKYNIISIIRLLLVLLIGYFFYKSIATIASFYFLCCFISICCFIALLKYHTTIKWKKNLYKHLLGVNADEMSYVKEGKLYYSNGSDYLDFKHYYTYDLDFFGENSLFHHLNRTETYIGEKKLAALLLKPLQKDEILQNQKAIEDLSSKVSWRQHFTALAKINNDSKADYDKLMKWIEERQVIPKYVRVLFYVMPLVLAVLIILSITTKQSVYFKMVGGIFSLNLAFVFRSFNKIQTELSGISKVSSIIKKYALLCDHIEQESFESEHLKTLQNTLKVLSIKASTEIKKLSQLFSEMDSANNMVVAFLFNGLGFYHFHKLQTLITWKKKYASSVKSWLSTIGTFESLNSLANFRYNNSDFTYPELNENYTINFTSLGHPLIKKDSRIDNDIVFNDGEFVILTGSNMSGKSTFLRTLGVNMVLASVGSVVCATKSNIHPLQVLVSMRQTDSLNENESYFYAEVKRLKQLIETLSNQKCFVLLDEILRGTNSEDKQSGTIQVIRKILSKNAIGIIATHDLEVCKTVSEYPNKLMNKCFEAEIIDDELVFDYKLKTGICKNKSATFLMKKMNVI